MNYFTRLLGSLVVLTALGLFGCSKVPYRIDIDQGNFITEEELSQLKVGMSKEAVQLAIGSPMLVDYFNQNRWDYIQKYRHGQTQDQAKSRVTLYFTNGFLSQIDRADFEEITPQPLNYDIRRRN